MPSLFETVPTSFSVKVDEISGMKTQGWDLGTAATFSSVCGFLPNCATKEIFIFHMKKCVVCRDDWFKLLVHPPRGCPRSFPSPHKISGWRCEGTRPPGPASPPPWPHLAQPVRGCSLPVPRNPHPIPKMVCHIQKCVGSFFFQCFHFHWTNLCFQRAGGFFFFPCPSLEPPSSCKEENP